MKDMDCITRKKNSLKTFIFIQHTLNDTDGEMKSSHRSSIKTKDFYLTFSLYTFYYNKTLLCLYIAPLNLKMATIVCGNVSWGGQTEMHTNIHTCVYIKVPIISHRCQDSSNNFRYLGIVRSIIQSLSISRNTHFYSFLLNIGTYNVTTSMVSV